MLKRSAICIFLVLLLVSLSSCSLSYTFVQDDYSGIGFGCSKSENNCFVGEISYSQGGSTEIIIPDEYNGLPVTQLGGYTGTGVPTPFQVVCNSDYFPHDFKQLGCDDEYILSRIDDYDEIEVENVVFKITLPKKLKELKFVKLNHIVCAEQPDGDAKILKVFRPVYYFTVPSDNKYFYTEDGKLYDKKTNELFSECNYEEYDYKE